MTWRASIVALNGVELVNSLDGLTVNHVTKELNAPRTASITVATLSPQLDELWAIADPQKGRRYWREIQLWYDATLVGWFIPTDINVGPVETNIELADHLWLLANHRVVGKLYDTNLLVNGDFESGTAGWIVEDEGSGAVTFSVGTSVNAQLGTKAATIEADTLSNNYSVYQSIELPATALRTDFVVSGYAWQSWVSPISVTRYEPGLVLRAYDNDGVLREENWHRLNSRTDMANWSRFSTACRVEPHDEPWTLEVHMAAPLGVVFWDHIRLVRVERLEYIGADQATIAAALIDHAQDTTIYKANLGLAKSCAATGVVRNRTYPYAEHMPIFEALTELADCDGGFDFGLVVTSTTKTFTTYYPRRGSATSVATLQWGVNITADWSWTFGLAKACSSIAFVGEGTTDAEGRADDREHQYARNVESFNGRLLEKVIQGPARASSQQLHALASAGLTRSYDPAFLTLTCHSDGPDNWRNEFVTGAIVEGDNVRVIIDHAFVDIDAQYRIHTLSLDPVTETLTFGLVEV